MKTMILLFLLAIQTMGQGYVRFNNRQLVDPETQMIEASAPVGLPDGTRLRGNDFTAGLFLIQGESLTQLASVFFYSGTIEAGFGFFAPPATLVQVPGLPAGSPATFRVRVWETAAGSYESAASGGFYYGEFLTASGTPLLSIPFLGDPNVGLGIVPDMWGIQPLTLIPEPASWSLLAAGGLFFLLRRRNHFV